MTNHISHIKSTVCYDKNLGKDILSTDVVWFSFKPNTLANNLGARRITSMVLTLYPSIDKRFVWTFCQASIDWRSKVRGHQVILHSPNLLQKPFVNIWCTLPIGHQRIQFPIWSFQQFGIFFYGGVNDTEKPQIDVQSCFIYRMSIFWVGTGRKVPLNVPY